MPAVLRSLSGRRFRGRQKRLMAAILRRGKTPSGAEVRAHLRRLVRGIRSRWPTTRVLFRGDGHYARPEAMTWCEENAVDYVFGLPGTKPLSRKVDETADIVPTERLWRTKMSCAASPKRPTEPIPGSRNGAPPLAIEATRLGLDIRFIVINLDHGSAELGPWRDRCAKDGRQAAAGYPNCPKPAALSREPDESGTFSTISTQSRHCHFSK